MRFPPLERTPPLERSPPLERPQGSSTGRPGALHTDSFAEAAAMARAARSNFESPSEAFDTKRLAVMIGGGATVVLAVVILGFKLFGSKSEAPRPAAPPVVQTPQYSQEITDLVAQTESAFKADDFKNARADVDKLRQIAPSHPRLAFFDGLLAQRSDASKGIGAAAAGARGTSKRAGQSSRRSDSNSAPDEKANVTAATAGSAATSPSSTPTSHTAGSASVATTRPASNTASTSMASTRSATASDSTSMASTRSASGSGAKLTPSTQSAPAAGSTSTTSTRSPPGAGATSTSATADESSASPLPELPPETPPGLTRPSKASAETLPMRDAGAPASGSAARPAGATGPSVATTASEPSAPSADAAPPAPTHVASSSVARRASSGEPPPVVQEAKLIRRVVPDYPSAAKRDGTKGSVDLEVTVSSRGVVEAVAVVAATPPDMFEKSAVAAVRKWKYDPRFVDGLPSEAHLKVHLDFGPGK